VGLGLFLGLALTQATISRGSIADVIQLLRTDISLLVNLLSILYCCTSRSAAAWVAANTFEAN
jgi:hypothetical protein